MSFEFLLDPFTEFHCRGTVRHSLKSIQQRLESLIDPCAGACGVKFLKHSVQMAARCVCVVFEWKAHDFRTRRRVRGFAFNRVRDSPRPKIRLATNPTNDKTGHETSA